MAVDHSPSGATITALRLEAGGRVLHLPIGDAVTTAVPDVLTPLPLAVAPVEGMTVIDGFPVVQVDLTHLLTGQPGTGRTLVVVCQGNSRIAFRTDRSSLAMGTVVPATECADFFRSFTPTDGASNEQTASPYVLPLHIILLKAQGRVFGVPAVSVECINRVTTLTNLRSTTDEPRSLVLLNDEALPSRPIPTRLGVETVPISGEEWGVVVTLPNERFVWMATSVLGLRTVACKKIRSVAIADEPPLLWYEDEQGDFVELIDPAGVLGGFCSIGPMTRVPESMVGFRSDLQLRCGPFRCLLPLAMTGRVLETVMSGLAKQKVASGDMPVINAARLFGFSGESNPRRGVVVTLEGDRKIVLAVDEINADTVGQNSEAWRLPAVPTPVNRYFDGVLREENSDTLIYRLRGFSIDLLPGCDEALMGWLPAQRINSF